jgi:hypothetical protein
LFKASLPRLTRLLISLRSGSPTNILVPPDDTTFAHRSLWTSYSEGRVGEHLWAASRDQDVIEIGQLIADAPFGGRDRVLAGIFIDVANNSALGEVD